mmetsp:Transcript_123379/g.348638  ORF Transcript_123379/g.348638 Transcript_123379/m.348638 type:complete len:246 (+) Transcript_123379:1930-2667(+)
MPPALPHDGLRMVGLRHVSEGARAAASSLLAAPALAHGFVCCEALWLGRFAAVLALGAFAGEPLALHGPCRPSALEAWLPVLPASSAHQRLSCTPAKRCRLESNVGRDTRAFVQVRLQTSSWNDSRLSRKRRPQMRQGRRSSPMPASYDSSPAAVCALGSSVGLEGEDAAACSPDGAGYHRAAGCGAGEVPRPPSRVPPNATSTPTPTSRGGEASAAYLILKPAPRARGGEAAAAYAPSRPALVA